MDRDYAAPDWRGLCEELVAELEGCRPLAEVPDSLARARAALAQPEPEVVGPTMQLPEQAPDEHPPSSLDRREIAAWYHGHGCGWQAARAVLARWGSCQGFLDDLAAPAPAEGEVGELVALIHQIALAWEPDACLLGNMTAGQLARAANLLERQAAPVPVAVSERLPGAEDCDAEGRFWAWCKATKEWCLRNRWHYREESERNAPGWASGWPYWLPFNALPIPGGEVEA